MIKLSIQKIMLLQKPKKYLQTTQRKPKFKKKKRVTYYHLSTNVPAVTEPKINLCNKLFTNHRCRVKHTSIKLKLNKKDKLKLIKTIFLTLIITIIQLNFLNIWQIISIWLIQRRLFQRGLGLWSTWTQDKSCLPRIVIRKGK